MTLFQDTCYVIGDGTGGTEKELGTAANREACIKMVKSREPSANGATCSKGLGPCKCYAEFGMTGSDGSASWQTCRFKGIVTLTYLLVFQIFIIDDQNVFLNPRKIL